MAKLPKQLSFARPLIFFIRRIIWKFLGASDTAAIIEEITLFPRSQPVDNRMSALWERLNILESHINWRLHGLPPRLVNIKLEQASLLAGSGEIEAALETFKKHYPIPPSLPELMINIVSQAKSIFMFPGDNNHEWNAVRTHLHSDAKVTIIDDTSDLFRYNEDNELVSIMFDMKNESIASDSKNKKKTNAPWNRYGRNMARRSQSSGRRLCVIFRKKWIIWKVYKNCS